MVTEVQAWSVRHDGADFFFSRTKVTGSIIRLNLDVFVLCGVASWSEASTRATSRRFLVTPNVGGLAASGQGGIAHVTAGGRPMPLLATHYPGALP